MDKLIQNVHKITLMLLFKETLIIFCKFLLYTSKPWEKSILGSILPLAITSNKEYLMLEGKNKIKYSTWLKRASHVESKFDRLNFHAKSKVKSKKYHKVKFDTSLKSCGHAESKILD